MVSKKDKKNSGWVSPNLTIPFKLAKEENIDLDLRYYDAWQDWRDGMRFNKDRSMIRSAYMVCGDVDKAKIQNQKLKRKEKIRKARKASPRNYDL